MNLIVQAVFVSLLLVGVIGCRTAPVQTATPAPQSRVPSPQPGREAEEAGHMAEEDQQRSQDALRLQPPPPARDYRDRPIRSPQRR